MYVSEERLTAPGRGRRCGRWLGTARMPGPDGGRVLRLKHVDYLEEHVEEEEFGEWHGE